MKQVAQTILDNSQEIMNLWEATVKEKIVASQHTNRIILRDHLPNMINDIAEILVRYHNGPETSTIEKYLEIVENSTDHGRHRATTKAYTVDQLIHEYIIFHRALTEVLRTHDAYNSEVSDLLKYILETAMLQSAASFSTSLQEMQEKLVGTLAHDLRNPLGVTYSLLELISREEDTDRVQMLVKVARRSLDKSIRLTEGLLDAVTVQAGEGMMLTFSEGDIVKEVETVFQEACQVYSQEIRLECSVKEINGVMDGTAIRRVLENLLTNAIKYGDISKPITIGLEDLGDKARLSVHNYGNPIPAEKQQTIFRFLTQSTEERATPLQSWGMGLTLIRIVAEAHGGQVTLTSSAEEGTRFTMDFGKNNKIGKVRTHVFNKAHTEAR